MYQWRDPERMTPQRTAELAEIDARNPRAIARSARVARFIILRGQGLGIREASARVGVSYWTGRHYEYERNERIRRAHSH